MSELETAWLRKRQALEKWRAAVDATGHAAFREQECSQAYIHASFELEKIQLRDALFYEI